MVKQRQEIIGMTRTSNRRKTLNGYYKLYLYWMCWEQMMDNKEYDHLSIKLKKRLICSDYLKLLFKGKYNRDDKL